MNSEVVVIRECNIFSAQSHVIVIRRFKKYTTHSQMAQTDIQHSESARNLKNVQPKSRFLKLIRIYYQIGMRQIRGIIILT